MENGNENIEKNFERDRAFLYEIIQYLSVNITDRNQDQKKIIIFLMFQLDMLLYFLLLNNEI